MIVHSTAGSRGGAGEVGTNTPGVVRDAMKAARVWDVSDAATASGVSLLEISEQAPVLVVFLRRFGCTFCREAMSDLAKQRQEIQDRGVRIVVVHMVEAPEARAYLERYDLGMMHGVGQISDPERKLYKAFELARARFRQLFGIGVIWRGLVATVLGGHWLGHMAGDAMQMPGAFLVKRGAIVRAYRHATAADRADYCEVAGVEGKGKGQA